MPRSFPGQSKHGGDTGVLVAFGVCCLSQFSYLGGPEFILADE